MSRDRRKSVVETIHPRLGVVRQCRLLGLCRSTFYCKTAGEMPKNPALMKRLDEIFLDVPFFVARRMARRTPVWVSMDGRGRWMDNVMVERLWRSLKYENVYLNAYETGTEARKGIGAWIDFHNARRPHSSLGDITPDEACCGQPGPPVLQDRNTEAA